MKERDIEHMWKVASNNPNHDTNWHDPVVIAFAELIRADEREACANIDFYEILRDICSKAQAQEYSNYIETAIRARGEK